VDGCEASRQREERACDDLALSCALAHRLREHLLDIVTTVRGDATHRGARNGAPKEFEGRMLAILDPDLRRAATRKQSAALIAALD